MPILNVEVVGEVSEQIRSDLARQLADRAGVVLGSRPQGTWVRLHFLPDSAYSENQSATLLPQMPVFVSLTFAEVPGKEELKLQLGALATEVASLVERPRANVHIIVEPPARGRIAFGGELLE